VIVVPEICSSERIARGIRLQLQIPHGLQYFEGHFPDCPLLPGVVQITWAIELGRQHLQFAGAFRALGAVKFTRVILPGTSVTLVLEFEDDKRRLDFAYELDGSTCSNGSALFDA
jgi:3-hydroxymyristoyl/3-hydroxydecanoyl-(acyl carrier protein) dehydratase